MEHFDTEENMNELMRSSQWKHLKAVKMNRVFYVDTRLWVDGWGVAGHTVILNQIVRCLTNQNTNGAQLSM
jgi:ABC-type Fe3+-hydroxamate transport system substrate-binding protein